jgi:polyisoprenoid-binding protein YceI
MKMLMLGLLALGLTGCDSGENSEPAAPPVVETKAQPEVPSVPAGPRTMGIDSASGRLDFVGGKMLGSTQEGGFDAFTGSASLEGGQLTSIDTTSTRAGKEKLQKHLKSDDFFDVVTFPKATFKSTSVSAADGGAQRVTGTLDFHGVSHDLEFPVQVTGNNLKGAFTMDRTLWEVSYPGKPDDLIKDEVEVTFDVSLK